MIVKVFPNRLDGVIKSSGVVADYINGANCFGNRVRVEGGGKFIKELVLKFNAKGTKLDLTDNEYLLPIVSVCSLYAFSNTEISGVEKFNNINGLIDAILSVGGYATINDGVLKIKGVAGINGGNLKTDDILIAYAFILAGTCAENITLIDYCGQNETELQEFISLLKDINGNIE